jgi:hypothetical protein
LTRAGVACCGARGDEHWFWEAMLIRRMIVALGFIACAPGAGVAGDIENRAREAEAKLAAGQHLEAVEILRGALGSLMARGPLALRRVQFITEAPKGFGLYQPRTSGVFRAGEPLIVYAEPVGVGWQSADGTNRAHINADFEIRTRDGRILGGQKDFGRFEFASRDQNQEIMTHLTIRLSGAPPGSYVFGATYRDQISGKSASLELPFEIR